MTTTDLPAASEEHRAALVAKLRERGWIRTEPVAQAVLAVPREDFLPDGVSLEDAYHVDRSVITVRDEHGVALSSVSAAYIMAAMLEQANLEPGHRVLEIGSGGLNAALIAQVVGPDGSVVSVDIDPDVTSRAQELLDKTGYSDRVRVLTADAGQGLDGEDPFDAVIVTVGMWDLAPGLLRMLKPAATIVVPLVTNGVTRTIAFRRNDNDEVLVSTSVEVAGFVGLQGAEAHADRVFTLPSPGGHKMRVRFDSGAPADMSVLDGALAGEPVTARSGVTVGDGESFSGLDLWLAWFMPGFCRIEGDKEFMTAGGGHWFPYGVVRDAGVAFLVLQPVDGRMEFTARGYGRDADVADVAADTLAEQVRAWDRDGRGSADVTFGYWPDGADRNNLPSEAAVLVKTHGVVTISWPGRRAATADQVA
ncbi:methyltransferase, FxLD system [Actinoplanes sp. ATCC 53533]|uniref:methyltransferase, FxLD system n=1 Tax=Actinoplanes sp. ATCC 53533 TaxID=1288362 RepID=UPI001F003B42|nr:methyltransferase, FxLD system [Actinoplanes sp. ATCC 53533]